MATRHGGETFAFFLPNARPRGERPTGDTMQPTGVFDPLRLRRFASFDVVLRKNQIGKSSETGVKASKLK